MNHNTPFLNYVAAEGFLPRDDFFLVDVGASGGIDPAWFVFRPHLRAVGFDPLVNEIQRLSRENSCEKIRYVDAFVGAHDYEKLFPSDIAADKVRSRGNHSHSRSSSLRAAKLGDMNYEKEVFNRGEEMVFSSRRIALDDFFSVDQRAGIDFLKIDTDGSDYPVLLGAAGTLEQGGVLGVTIECQFHGPVHDQANLFCNIDRFLRAKGFSLYDLEVHRYSRATLPRPFVYDIPAQTTRGQVQWGEALYFRDLTDPDYSRMWGRTFDLGKQIKLACLFELFHLQDCAVELLLHNRSAFETVLPVERCLDLLTPARGDQALRYQDNEREFVYWSSRRQWRQFGRTATSGDAPDNAAPQPPLELCTRLGRFLGRDLPVPPREFEEAQATLQSLLNARNSGGMTERLVSEGRISPVLQPLLLHHLGLAWKEGNTARAEALEVIHGRLNASATGA